MIKMGLSLIERDVTKVWPKFCLHYDMKRTVIVLIYEKVSCLRSSIVTILIVMLIIKLNLFPVLARYRFIFSPRFAIFKNVVHNLEPGETPSNSASHQVQNYAQRS